MTKLGNLIIEVKNILELLTSEKWGAASEQWKNLMVNPDYATALQKAFNVLPPTTQLAIDRLKNFSRETYSPSESGFVRYFLGTLLVNLKVLQANEEGKGTAA